MHIVLDRTPDDGVVYVTLSAPADHRTSFSGSSLPFPSEQIAFDRRVRPQRYHVDEGSHMVVLAGDRVPNWYYRDGVYGPPYAKVDYVSDGHVVSRMYPVHGVPRTPSRSLTSPRYTLTTSRHGPVESQERALMRRAMPGTPCPS